MRGRVYENQLLYGNLPVIPMKAHEGRPIWEWKWWITITLLIISFVMIYFAYTVEIFSLLRCEQIPFVQDVIRFVQNLVHLVVGP
jgi:hypothetical protein